MKTEQAKSKIKEICYNAVTSDDCKTLEQQKEAVWDSVRKESAIIKAMAKLAIDHYCQNAIYEIRHELRSQCVYGKPERKYPNETVRDYDVMVKARGLLGTMYCGDKPIGECTKAEILAQAEAMRSQARGKLVSADIFATTARKMKDTGTAKDYLSNKQFEKIVRNVNRAVKVA